MLQRKSAECLEYKEVENRIMKLLSTMPRHVLVRTHTNTQIGRDIYDEILPVLGHAA